MSCVRVGAHHACAFSDLLHPAGTRVVNEMVLVQFVVAQRSCPCDSALTLCLHLSMSWVWRLQHVRSDRGGTLGGEVKRQQESAELAKARAGGKQPLPK